MGANVSTTFISCPVSPSKTLGIKLPFLVMIIKNCKKYFTFEVQVGRKNAQDRQCRPWRGARLLPRQCREPRLAEFAECG